MYNEVEKKELEEVVKEIVLAIYTKERKEKKGKKRKGYLPRLSDDLPGKLFASSTFLLRRHSTHRS